MRLRFILILFFLSAAFGKNNIFIRTNQLGFLKDDIKTSIILSDKNIQGQTYIIKNILTQNNVRSGVIGANKGEYGAFNFSYFLDYSDLKSAGVYRIEIGGTKSYPFDIAGNGYKRLMISLLDFFKFQRCGYTNPVGHKECHIADATQLIENKRVIERKIDVTGGWHDAGDYVKFFNTTAYSTYMLLFAYDFDKEKFGFDKNNNGEPDILEEAKIGLDWMIRCNFDEGKLITQVSDLRDHSVGWRMPGKDTLRFNRPAYVDIGKNLVGIHTAVMALASKIWRETFHSQEYSDFLLSNAEKMYLLRRRVKDIATAGSGMYVDQSYKGKMALGAVELYRVTGKSRYLFESKKYATEAGSDHWWSWGNINSLAHYRIAKYDKQFSGYILKNLAGFDKTKDEKLFGEGAAYSWGTNNTLLGIALQYILYEDLEGKSKYEELALLQRDFTLGRNPWGISFFYGTGTNFTKHIHHQIPHFNGGKLPGAFAAGPVTREFLNQYNIKFEKRDRYSLFQTDNAVYRDDRMDYVTNEPTITAAATAIFVMGFYSN